MNMYIQPGDSGIEPVRHASASVLLTERRTLAANLNHADTHEEIAQGLYDRVCNIDQEIGSDCLRLNANEVIDLAKTILEEPELDDGLRYTGIAPLIVKLLNVVAGNEQMRSIYEDRGLLST